MSDQAEKLISFLRPLCGSGVALAFSGGVDSGLLLALLKKMQQEKTFPLMVLNAVTPLQGAEDLENVKKMADWSGLAVKTVFCDVFALPEVKNNSRSRCYFCKKYIFEKMLGYAAKEGITHILEGTHADDLHLYRPGRKALAELGVISPFAELGISKKEIRQMAAALDVPTADRPSSPCLATRFDYGVELEEEALRQVGEGERFLRTLLPEQTDLRLRVQEKTARIEVSESCFHIMLEHRAEIRRRLQELGFEKVTLDLSGFLSGSFDKNSKEEKNV